MKPYLSLPLFLLACTDGTDEPPTDVEPPPALPSTVPEGETLAAIANEEDPVFFGGASADAAPGDALLMNNKVRFFVQGDREGHYYTQQSGAVIDADLARPPGEPGRDLIDDHLPLFGFSRVLDSVDVEIISDGADGTAHVRVSGQMSPLQILAGATEADSFTTIDELDFTTDYKLPADSHLLEVTTTVTWNERDPLTVQPIDAFVYSDEVALPYQPGSGRVLEDVPTGEWTGVIGREQEVALALFSEEAPFEPSLLFDLLGEVGSIIGGEFPEVVVEQGQSTSWTRTIGVGPDFATLTDEWYARQSLEVETLQGEVSSEGNPLPGVLVNLLDSEGKAVTLAVTDAQGRWTADVPQGRVTQAYFDGRGTGIFDDLPEGSGWYGAYTLPNPRKTTLESFTNETATPPPAPNGYGVAGPLAVADLTSPVQLLAPAVVTVTPSDALPTTVEIQFKNGDPVSADPRYARRRPYNLAALGISRGGAVDVALEPGDYTLVAHRGARWEPDVQEFTVTSGQNLALDLRLEEAYAKPSGFVVGDPHSHATPSPDGRVTMSARLMTMASNGVDIHFGTEHDNVAEYGPLLDALGLDGVLRSINGLEVSPVVRGHFNIWPVIPDFTKPNNGAVLWWKEWEDLGNTDAYYTRAKDLLPSEGVLATNHPRSSSGLFSAANLNIDEGRVIRGDKWTEQFTAMETANNGVEPEVFADYLALTARGVFPTPLGVSDSHDHRSGVGRSFTWFNVGVDDLSDVTDERLLEAANTNAVVASTGPWLSVTIDDEWAPGRAFTGEQTVSVEVKSPSWMPVSRVVLYKNGARSEVQDITGEAPDRFSGTFTLAPDDDAVYIFVVESDSPMNTVYTTQPWAMSAALTVDPQGDGYTSPLPPFQ